MRQCSAFALEKTDYVPADARVKDYDELSDDDQSLVTALLTGESNGYPSANGCGLRSGEYVKFTGYYRVDCA
ncbi:hypothetical protein ACLI4U_11595 [Natrialbaceae archaeon A-CW2]|uniref:hypothetical protein n=1 Tax=Natronosalvus amylolyticus TaxID=2961994 RepID=UPI0020CA2013|nr:hypothetical protein [Natronosalvus amylolyticus]